MAKYSIKEGQQRNNWGKQLVYKDGNKIGEFSSNEDAHRFITPLLRQGDTAPIPEECSKTQRTQTMHAQKRRAMLEKVNSTQRQPQEA